MLHYNQPLSNDNIDVTLPIPHAFFKSILVEYNTGKIHMWSFIIPNKIAREELETFRVETSKVEKISGLFLWDTLLGTKMIREKNKVQNLKYFSLF